MEKYKNLAYKISIFLILLFGIFIRIKLYLVSDVFEDDECRLGLSMFGKNVWQMFLPLGPLSSTPIFMFISKIIADISNYNEYALKFLPFVFSILSLGLFYKICNEYFSRKISTVISTYLFSVNLYAIYFSSIFKTYSLEIFISLLCLYYLPKINIANLNTKQVIITAASIAILPLISLPSLFFIGLFFLVNIFENYKNKTFYKKLGIICIPFLIIFATYYFVNLLPTKIMQMTGYSQLWQDVYSIPLISGIVIILNSLLDPNNYVLCTFITIISSTVYVITTKQEHTKFNFYLYTILLSTFFVNYFHLYPTAIGRTAVYMLPVLIIVLVKLIDVLRVKSILFYIIVLFFVIGTYKYYLPSHLYQINDLTSKFRNYAPKSLLLELKEKYNVKTDYIIAPDASLYSFCYYAERMNFEHFSEKKYLKHINLIPVRIQDNSPQDTVWEVYNNLDPQYNYWFYLIKEYAGSNERAYTIEWLEKQNILYKKQDKDSYLYYISGVKKVNYKN